MRDSLLIKPYEISNIVANYQLATGLNVALLARHCVLSDQIVSIKMPGIIERNRDTITVVSEFDEIANSNEYKFSNQCTFSIRLPESLVNIKVFNNGKFVLTGYRDIKVAQKALKILLEAMSDLTKKEHPLNYRFDFIRILNPLLKEDTQRTQFHRVQRKFLEVKSRLVELARYCQIEPDKIDELLIILKTADTERLKDFLGDQKTLFWLKAYEFQDLYQSSDQTQIDKLMSDRIYKLTFDPESLNDHKYHLQIKNINTNFQTNFSLDREKTKNMINRNTDMKADYKTTGYSAVNVKYLSQIDCLLHDKQKPGQICTCKKVTILLFNEGGGIINGARSLAQIDDAFNQIKSFFINHKENVVTRVQTSQKKDINQELLPDLLIEKSGKLYLKKSLISANVTNRYFLKRNS